jgi:hypothetical protein
MISGELATCCPHDSGILIRPASLAGHTASHYAAPSPCICGDLFAPWLIAFVLEPLSKRRFPIAACALNYFSDYLNFALALCPDRDMLISLKRT